VKETDHVPGLVLTLDMTPVALFLSVIRLNASGKFAEGQPGYDGGSSGAGSGGTSWNRVDPENSEPQHVHPFRSGSSFT